MTTPADWYPDPHDPASLRYWDGLSWTEHRAPAAPPTAVPTPVQPYDTHPRTSYEAPSAESTSPDSMGYDVRPSPVLAPHPESSDRPNGEPNNKLVFGIIGGSVAILVVIAAVLTMLLFRQSDTPVTASPATTPSRTATTSETPSETTPESTEAEAPLPPPPGAEGSDGDYAFSVVSTETGDTITSTVDESVETTADGMYYVVHLNVANTGAAPLTFVATFQALNGAGQTFPLDDEATAFLGGTVATIDPGTQVETPLVYDVPVGTEPDTLMLRADPSTVGVELPLR